eukprot:TRINITY_DN4237_c0_g2_i1.p1 TRINITY_DN4237_c0_g2~~TRINITY_DN4237_c0_g2_i1.p1  ORF type:complete len:624 (+),score=152.33 TRINITY_DN4237_c0_g2_i1:45-1916(+)
MEADSDGEDSSLAEALSAAWKHTDEARLRALLDERAALDVEAGSRCEEERLKASQASDRAEAYAKRCRLLRERLRSALVDSAAAEQQSAAEELDEKDLLLGQVVDGVMGEVWQWADGPRSAKAKLAAVLEAQKKRERAKRAAGRRARGQPASPSALPTTPEPDPSSPRSPRSEGVSAAISRQRQRYTEQHRKATELKLRQESAQYESEKSLHIKATRRMRGEEASPLSGFPEFDHGRYVTLDLLGKGGFSEVWRAADLHVGRYVAVKVHQLDPTWPAARRAQYVRHSHREYEIQRAAQHPRIVQLYGSFRITDTSFAAVLEYTPHGDLDSHLKSVGAMKESCAKSVMAQMLSALSYLHGRGVIHYDLKPANVLFFSASTVKLTDFGLSKITSAPLPDSCRDDPAIELTSLGAGTYWYLPPECFDTHRRPVITAKVDIFSAGVVFFQMLYGRRPFGHDLSQKQVISDGIMANAREVVFPHKKVSAEARSLISSCVSYFVGDRPGAVTLLSLPYFTTALDQRIRSARRQRRSGVRQSAGPRGTPSQKARSDGEAKRKRARPVSDDNLSPRRPAPLSDAPSPARLSATERGTDSDHPRKAAEPDQKPRVQTRLEQFFGAAKRQKVE